MVADRIDSPTTPQPWDDHSAPSTLLYGLLAGLVSKAHAEQWEDALPDVAEAFERLYYRACEQADLLNQIDALCEEVDELGRTATWEHSELRQGRVRLAQLRSDRERVLACIRRTGALEVATPAATPAPIVRAPVALQVKATDPWDFRFQGFVTGIAATCLALLLLHAISRGGL